MLIVMPEASVNVLLFCISNTPLVKFSVVVPLIVLSSLRSILSASAVLFTVTVLVVAELGQYLEVEATVELFAPKNSILTCPCANVGETSKSPVPSTNIVGIEPAATPTDNLAVVPGLCVNVTPLANLRLFSTVKALSAAVALAVKERLGIVKPVPCLKLFVVIIKYPSPTT